MNDGASITWNYVKALRQQDAVKNAAEMFGVTLPSSFERCLAKNNGGRPSSKAFATKVSDGHVFNCLFSYNEGDSNYALDVVDEAFVNRGIWPFAFEAGGDLICLDLQSEVFLLLNFEAGILEAIDIESNIELFSEFIK